MYMMISEHLLVLEIKGEKVIGVDMAKGYHRQLEEIPVSKVGYFEQ